MIRYHLTCKDGHDFDSWFASGDEYDRLEKTGMLSCAVCGAPGVEKALMAPRLGAGESDISSPLSQPASPAEQALRALRKKIEKEAVNVGRDFAREARAMHEGEAPERSIYGEARPDEARALIKDGGPIAPLPWRTARSN